LGWSDSTAAYWNPAAFGFYKEKDVRKYENKDFGLGVGVGLGYSIHNNLGEKIDDILNYDYDAVANDISNNGAISISNLDDYVNLVNNVAKITDKDAVVFKANGYVASRIGHFGVGVYALGNIAALPILDLQNISVNSANTDIIDSLAGIGRDKNLDTLTQTQYDDLVGTISSFTGWSTTDAQNFVYAIDDSLNANGITSIDQQTYDAVVNTAKIASNAVTGGSYDQNESKIKFYYLL
jgi:hypothetical protein